MFKHLRSHLKSYAASSSALIIIAISIVAITGRSPVQKVVDAKYASGKSQAQTGTLSNNTAQGVSPDSSLQTTATNKNTAQLPNNSTVSAASNTKPAAPTTQSVAVSSATSQQPSVRSTVPAPVALTKITVSLPIQVANPDMTIQANAAPAQGYVIDYNISGCDERMSVPCSGEKRILTTATATSFDFYSAFPNIKAFIDQYGSGYQVETYVYELKNGQPNQATKTYGRRILLECNESYQPTDLEFDICRLN